MQAQQWRKVITLRGQLGEMKTDMEGRGLCRENREGAGVRGGFLDVLLYFVRSGAFRHTKGWVIPPWRAVQGSDASPTTMSDFGLWSRPVGCTADLQLHTPTP